MVRCLCTCKEHCQIPQPALRIKSCEHCTCLRFKQYQRVEIDKLEIKQSMFKSFIVESHSSMKLIKNTNCNITFGGDCTSRYCFVAQQSCVCKTWLRSRPCPPAAPKSDWLKAAQSAIKSSIADSFDTSHQCQDESCIQNCPAVLHSARERAKLFSQVFDLLGFFS